MQGRPIIVPTMQPTTANQRNAGLGLIRRINRWMITGAVAFSGLISLVAAKSFQGHTTTTGSSVNSSATQSSSSTSSGSNSTSSSGSSSLQQPSQTPSSSSSSSSPVVSGGS